MSDRLQILKERSLKRRELLAQQYGLSSPDSLGDVLSGKQDHEDQKALRKIDRSLISPPMKRRNTDDSVVDTSRGIDPSKLVVESKDGEKEEEREEVYRDSTTFLKGTQSANPHNDYCQHFVDTGERPQNFIRDTGLANRFEEYPKLRELIRLKDELIVTTNIPPMYMKCDLEKYDLRDLNCKFDAILLEPPLEEYQRSVGLVRDKYWNWQEIERLEIEDISANRAFIWIWCGSSDGLDAARRCLRKWGFRRCEDICWIKTNSTNPGHNKNLETKSIFQRTKEHCLMGIKGTVRRSTDGDFIHANVDIDLIIEEEKPYGSDEKPVEIYHIIEHFCMGRRRLHIFGRDSTIRPGWLTMGPDVTSSNFDSENFNSYFNKSEEDYLTGCTEEIERLRPKSPPPKVKGGPNAGANLMGDGSMGGGPPRGHPRGGLGGRGGPSTRGPPRGGPSRGGYGGRGWAGHRQGPPQR